jgi:hypothetical protein
MRTSPGPALIYCAWAALIIGVVLPALSFHRHLYADGAVYFIRILENHSWFFAAAHRRAAQVLTQWPVVAAIRLGCVNSISYDPGARWNPYGPGNETRFKSIALDYGIVWKGHDDRHQTAGR